MNEEGKKKVKSFWNEDVLDMIWLSTFSMIDDPSLFGKEMSGQRKSQGKKGKLRQRYKKRKSQTERKSSKELTSVWEE